MVLLIVITTVVLCLLVDWLSSRAGHPEPVRNPLASPRDPRLEPSERVSDLRLQPDMSYHPAHSWALAVGPDRVRVGIDEFTVCVLGPPDGVELPRRGARVVQGRPAWYLCRDGWRAPVLSPVSGRVAAVNSLVAVHADVLQRDAYGAGWLLEIETEDVVTSFNNLLHGDMARRWLEDAAAHARRYAWRDRDPSPLAAPPPWWPQAVREFLRTDAVESAHEERWPCRA